MPAQGVLALRRASGFRARLRGLHAWPGLPWHTGLHLAPCRAIHTFGLAYAIDVVFLDAVSRELKLVAGLGPWRVAICLAAASVVELPAGYCAAHPGYADAIARCLRHCPHCRRSGN